MSPKLKRNTKQKCPVYYWIGPKEDWICFKYYRICPKNNWIIGKNYDSFLVLTGIGPYYDQI